MTDTTLTYLAIISDSYEPRSELVYLGDNRSEAENRLYARYCDMCDIHKDEMRNGKSFRFPSKETFLRAASDEFFAAYIDYDDFDMTVPHRINFELHVFRHVQKTCEPDSYEQIIDKRQKYFYPTASINDKDNGYELV